MSNVDNTKIFNKVLNGVRGKLTFNKLIKPITWLRVGGEAELFFQPYDLDDLCDFLHRLPMSVSVFPIGVCSNLLVGDYGVGGAIVRLGREFTKISCQEEFITAGAGLLDSKVADYAASNGVDLSFLKTIPGTIGGAIKMNAGCYGKEFKDIIVSVQAIDFYGKVLTIPASNISFNYRSTDLSKNLIFLSGTFKGTMSSKEKIKLKIEDLKNKKELTQPQRVKTSGSTFKNPVNQTNKKVWELIKESIDIKEANKMFGDATLSEKHCNFLINKEKASSKDMKNLINFIKENVYKKTGVNLELEIVLTS